MAKELVEIKGEMLLVAVLQLASVDMTLIRDGIQQRCTNSPQLFTNSPLVVDGSRLGEACAELDMLRLRIMISELGLIPVGIRNIPESCHAAAINAGWAVLRAAKAAPARQERTAEREPEEPQPCSGTSLRVIERPLRSGQQIYFPEGSIVILQHTSAGSEILAGGSVHVYGSLRGRVLAGIGGDTSARIFCQKLEAELVAIAGNYRLLDDIDTNLKGQPAMIWLEGEKLRITPMF